jgi:microsomal dipeptidase-like Zn-dependent dipeptidase
MHFQRDRVLSRNVFRQRKFPKICAKLVDPCYRNEDGYKQHGPSLIEEEKDIGIVIDLSYVGDEGNADLAALYEEMVKGKRN